MAKAKKLTDEQAELLAEAEKAAKAGFNSQTKQLNEEVYGSVSSKFDPTTEMKEYDPDISPTGSYVPSEEEVRDTVVQDDTEELDDNIPEDPEARLKWTADMLKQIDQRAPTYNALKQWKDMHGNIFILNIQDKVYIYRFIKRQEWSQLQANEQFNKMTPVQQEDHIVERCLLWPQMDPVLKASMPAGAPSMLAEQIRIQSMFLDPIQVANITLKL